jgi:hypothetical protein
MLRRTIPIAALAACVLAACGERPDRTPTAPALTTGPDFRVSPETARLEGAARRLARALRDPGFRSRLHQKLQASPIREGKIHFQRSFGSANRGELRALARLNAESEGSVDSAFRSTPALEVYLPVPGHRSLWQGDENVLVATAARDKDVPVAFDLNGGRHLLDPTRPPDTPVLAVVPVETNFDPPSVRAQAVCSTPDCGDDGGGGTNNLVQTPGLYMSRAHFVGDFEGWLKGSPEFEIHVMGQKGSTDSLVKYQCAAEHRPSPYYWNGGKDWSGNVMLFSQTEINSYKAAHPGETFRLVAMEDDDTSCEMKVDPDRWKTFVGAIGPLYQDITGAIDSGSVKKYLAAGKSLRKFLSALASWIKTNDDLIGNAMEDKVVSEYHAGYNWILRADNNVTNGWVNLEMR